MNKSKNNKGITLIALVITIVVLLILVGVTLLTLTGENGILGKSKKADEEANKQTATEIINLKITNAQIKSYTATQTMPTLQYLADIFYEDKDIEYVYNESQKTASIEKKKIDVTGEYIYTKLGEYPYEFKIDSKLRLAAIDDVKVAESDTSYDELLQKINTMVTREEYNSLLAKVEDLKSEVETLKNRPTTTPMIDTSKLLKSLSEGETYTATEDCIFVGCVNASAGGGWFLYLDDVVISWIGGNGNIAISFPSIFIKKGSTIKVERTQGDCVNNSLNIYAVK